MDAGVFEREREREKKKENGSKKREALISM